MQVLKLILPVFVLVLHIGCSNDNNKKETLVVADIKIKPVKSVTLTSWLDENSGSIFWKDTLWLQNDSSEPVLYGVDTETGEIIGKIIIPNLKMQDWESVAHDDKYLYLGDFGNNFNYRKNLRIYRVEKESLNTNDVKIDTIRYDYEDRVDYSYNEVLNTDFDCESMFVDGDSIYLFTKQWKSKGTALYSVPAEPGNYMAKKKSEYYVEGLITEAFKIPGENTVLLTGYNKLMNPFLVVLEHFFDNHFLSNKVTKINIDLLVGQIETICQGEDGLFYLTSEGVWRIDPELYVVEIM